MREQTTLKLLLLGLLSASCGRKPDLVVYCALDQEFAEPMIRRYEKETGLQVHVEFDVEADKTVGLVMRLREESPHPRCDVFWNNEVAHTVQLAQDGMLEVYDSPSAKDIPPVFRDADHRWTGFAARARVLIVNTTLADPKEIKSMWDLVDPKWKGKTGMARPVTGTTLTHMAALYAILGDKRADEYLNKIHDLAPTGGVNLTNGNASVARLVGDGKLAFGWTDSDDYAVTLQRGSPVAAVYPDADTCGTLLIPNTIAITHGAPHMSAARAFVDWALRPETERQLAFSDSAQIPVRANVERPKSVLTPGQFKAMAVDYKKIGVELEKHADSFKRMFID